MEYKVMMPSAIWQDYNPSAEPLEIQKIGAEAVVSEQIESSTDTLLSSGMQECTTLDAQNPVSEPTKAVTDEETSFAEESSANAEEKTTETAENPVEIEEKIADTAESTADSAEKTADSEEKTSDTAEKKTDSQKAIPASDGIDRYRFTALNAEDGSIRVAVRVYRPSEPTTRTVLIVHEYHRPPEKLLVEDLARNGYNVVVPDLSAVGEEKTIFPPSYAYGEYAKAGDHIRKVMPTAKETCQYLYAIIIKRTITFIRREISDGNLILVGLGDAVEVAMQVAGSGAEVDGLACLNGAGYREYIKQNRYGSTAELIIDEERMCWLTGIASVAYAKYVKVPTLIAIGSNARKSDIDRVSNLRALLDNDNVHVVFSPRATDFLLPEAYQSFLIWLKAVSENNVQNIPDIPDIDIRVNEEGKLYFDVDCDPSSIIEKVTIYYSYRDYNHEVRDWHEIDGLAVSYNEYIASPTSYDEKQPLFAFAEVRYASGLTLSSLLEYVELKGLPVKPAEDKSNSRIVVVYQARDGVASFVEDYDGTVLMTDGIKAVTTARGTKGITSELAGLRTYHIDPQDWADDDRLLQIDLFSEKPIEVSVTLIGDYGDGVKQYTAIEPVADTKGLFIGYRFKLNDFKDESLKPLAHWNGIKALSIRGDKVVVGNILFI